MTLPRRTAADVVFARHDPIWVRQRGGRLVPGFFDHYGTIRVAVRLVAGARDAVYVSPRSVFARGADDEVAP